MSARLRQRLLQGTALLVIVTAGVVAWHEVVRPDPELISNLAREKLREIFGPDVTFEHVRVDLVAGVTVEGLRVPAEDGTGIGLEAAWVEVRHDLIALASGLYRPQSIHIEQARIGTHETEAGFALDFPFTLEASEAETALPRIVLTRSTMLYRALADSARLRGGSTLEVTGIELDVLPEGRDVLGIEGSFETRGLGQDQVRIRVEGSAKPEEDAVLLGAVWEPFRITEELLSVLAPDVAAHVEGQVGEWGHLVVSLSRHPDRAEGELRVGVRYRGQVKVDLGGVPGVERIDARSLEQLEALLRRADLDLEVTPEGASLQGLVDALGTGRMAVEGYVREGGEVVSLTIRIKGLELSDPAIQEALGETGRDLMRDFEPRGLVDAEIRVTKRPGTELAWEVDAILEDASFRFVGSPDPDGTPGGFPYLVENAIGAIHVRGPLVTFDDVIGLHGAETTVRIRSPWERSWTGGETGRIRITDEGPDIRLTVDARNIAVDEDLWDAVRGSEFHDMRDLFWLDGVVDQVEVDIITVPGRDDKAKTEVRLTLGDESFRYARFPLLLRKVKGQVELRRPLIAQTARGSLFRFDVTGEADGADVHVWAEYDVTHGTGLLNVEAKGLSIAGELTDTILAAEPTRDGLARVWRYLDPRGRADVSMEIPIEDDPRPLRLTAELRGASIRLDAEEAPHPIEVTDLTGTLRVVDERVELAGLEGRLGTTAVTVEGWIDGGPEGTWELSVKTDVLRTSPELLASIQDLVGGEPILPAGLELAGGARLTLDLDLHKAAGEDAPLEVGVRVADLDGTLRLADGLTLAVHGDRLHVEGDRVEIEALHADAEGVRLDIDRVVVDGDDMVGRVTLHLEDYAPTDELLALLPEDARDLLVEWAPDRRFDAEALAIDAAEDGTITFEGDLALIAAPDAPPGGGPRGRIEVRPLRLSPEDAAGRRTLTGRVRFQGFTLGEDIPVEDLDGEALIDVLTLGDDISGRGRITVTRAKVFDIGIQDVVVPFLWRDGILTAAPVHGTVAAGRLAGRLVLHTREPMAYEGEASIEGFRLETLRNDLAPTGPPLAGLGNAQIVFQSRSGETRDLTGRGRVSIRDGNLGDLPVVANIFAFFGTVLGVEEPPRFERADAQFTLKDEVITLQRFDLAGPLFEMPGRGTVDFGGFVDLVFTPDIIKSFAVPGIMQFPVLGDVVDVLLREDWLYAIRLRGDIETAEPEVMFVPPLGLEGDQPFEGTGVPQLPPRRIPRWFR